MLYNRKYIKGLMAKKLQQGLSVEEELQLEAGRNLLGDEMFDYLFWQVLEEMEGQIPEGTMIPKKVDLEVSPVKKSIPLIKRNNALWTEIKGLGASAAVIMVLLFTAIYFLREDENVNKMQLDADCLHLAGNIDIPVSESTGSIRWGDKLNVPVNQDKEGVVRQIGSLEISRNKNGVLKLNRIDNKIPVTADSVPYVQIRTGVLEQCVVELEDGTRVRLNAQSVLYYPVKKRDTLSVYLSGEAYVDAAAAKREAKLRIHTEYARLRPVWSQFVVVADKSVTKAVLKCGLLDMRSYSSGAGAVLMEPDEFAMVSPLPTGPTEVARDTLIMDKNVDFDMVSMWTKAMRCYKDVPLKTFVEQMGRWEGFTVKDIRCIPKGKTINVNICYRGGREEVFAAIRKEGIKIRLIGDMISFCDEDVNTEIALWEGD